MNQQGNHLEGFSVLTITLTVDGPWLQNGSSQFSLIKRKTRLEASPTDEAIWLPISQGSLQVLFLANRGNKHAGGGHDKA